MRRNRRIWLLFEAGIPATYDPTHRQFDASLERLVQMGFWHWDLERPLRTWNLVIMAQVKAPKNGK